MAFWLPILYLGRVGWETAKEQFRVVLALAGAGIRNSCSGYAGFRPWLLAAGPARRRKITRCHARENVKTRVDRRCTRVFDF